MKYGDGSESLAVPTVAHVKPSADWNAVTVSARSSSFNQDGALAVPAGLPGAATSGAAVVTDTVEKSAVAVGAAEPLVTARPTKTVSVIGIMSVPISCHVVPSEERDAVNVAPRRSTFSQSAAPVPALVRTLGPPTFRRR